MPSTKRGIRSEKRKWERESGLGRGGPAPEQPREAVAPLPGPAGAERAPAALAKARPAKEALAKEEPAKEEKKPAKQEPVKSSKRPRKQRRLTEEEKREIDENC